MFVPHCVARRSPRGNVVTSAMTASRRDRLTRYGKNTVRSQSRDA
jgi:hypothetical protein